MRVWGIVAIGLAVGGCYASHVGSPVEIGDAGASRDATAALPDSHWDAAARPPPDAWDGCREPSSADCDGDGVCEADLETDRDHCGACGNTCDMLQVCVASACVRDAIVSVSPALYRHSCVSLESGRVFCWGRNEAGELGFAADSEDHLSASLPVEGIPPVVQVSVGGYSTCARTAAGEVWCWGANDEAQLGQRHRMPVEGPVVVELDEPSQWVESMAGGVCSLGTSGRLMCWGHQFQRFRWTEPHELAGMPLMQSWRVAGLAGCGLDLAGVPVCWGSPSRGIAGMGGATSPFATPFSPPVPRSLVALSCDHHCCGIDGDRGLWCWGNDSVGVLGDGMPDPADSFPSLVDGLAGVGAAATSGFALTIGASCAIASGRLYCWGGGGHGLNASGDPESVIALPAEIPLDVTPRSLAHGISMICLIGEHSELRCWGASNDFGQMGIGARGTAYVPTPVVGFE